MNRIKVILQNANRQDKVTVWLSIEEIHQADVIVYNKKIYTMQYLVHDDNAVLFEEAKVLKLRHVEPKAEEVK